QAQVTRFRYTDQTPPPLPGERFHTLVLAYRMEQGPDHRVGVPSSDAPRLPALHTHNPQHVVYHSPLLMWSVGLTRLDIDAAIVVLPVQVGGDAPVAVEIDVDEVFLGSPIGPYLRLLQGRAFPHAPASAAFQVAYEHQSAIGENVPPLDDLLRRVCVHQHLHPLALRMDGEGIDVSSRVTFFLFLLLFFLDIFPAPLCPWLCHPEPPRLRRGGLAPLHPRL
ncbi:30s ribosomal protein s5, partial [Nannochloropsis gaditana CCMP526]|uniref:30s ribosomal protein s5 n=1 Tax=Nannochloropsis gaditana (strain CCMP526) TaxID=1093141 RepID=UPI00029F5313